VPHLRDLADFCSGADVDKKDPEFVCDDDGIFVIADGVKIAKRERGLGFRSSRGGQCEITRAPS
jgi:hypothetical protein